MEKAVTLICFDPSQSFSSCHLCCGLAIDNFLIQASPGTTNIPANDFRSVIILINPCVRLEISMTAFSKPFPKAPKN